MSRLAPFIPGRAAIRPLVALALFGLTACLSVYWAYTGPRGEVGAKALRVADELRDAARVLRVTSRDSQSANRPNGEPALAARSFLADLDKAASLAGVQVTRLTPRQSEPGTFNVELLSAYGPLLRFMAASESLGGIVKGLQIRPSDDPDKATLQTAAFSMALGNRRGASPLETVASSRADPNVEAMHPFQAPQLVTALDVSAQYHLTGITRIGTERMATIEGRDYFAGDQLDGMRVEQVYDTEIRLTAPGRSFVIRFRPRVH